MKRRKLLAITAASVPIIGAGCLTSDVLGGTADETEGCRDIEHSDYSCPSGDRLVVDRSGRCSSAAFDAVGEYLDKELSSSHGWSVGFAIDQQFEAVEDGLVIRLAAGSHAPDATPDKDEVIETVPESVEVDGGATCVEPVYIFEDDGLIPTPPS